MPKKKHVVREKAPRLAKTGKPDRRLKVNHVEGERKRLAHWFKPGHVPTSSATKPGARGPNKVTRVLQEALLLAAEEVGNVYLPGEGLVGYFKVHAIDNPKTFMALLGRVIPLQVHLNNNKDDDKPQRMTREELRQLALARGLPTAIFDAAIPIGNGSETIDVPADDELDTDKLAEGEHEEEA